MQMMQRFYLRRRYFEHGTFGTLHRADNTQICVTIECPWLNNKVSVSCVPEGEYLIKQHKSPKFGNCYLLESHELGVGINPPSLRTHILIHAANRVLELEGCLATGISFGILGSEWAVLKSAEALKKLRSELNDQKAKLIIMKA